MQYPLSLSFKVLAIAQQVTVSDAAGTVIFHVKQKAFKLKEDVTVFGDTAQTRPLYTIKADRVLDFSGRYQFTDAATGAPVGSVKRQGMKSLWKAQYDVFAPGVNANAPGAAAPLLSISEENPWIKVLDGVLGEIPVVGMFTGYLFHPAYLAARPGGSGETVLRLVKEPAFFEGRFRIEQKAALAPEEETRALLALLMLVLLERGKG